ncbi:hypothetical protein EJ105_18415 [Xanthobacter aminoxidans]|nr:hypothetical protein [Xanthobacter aminoxidans]MCL8384138.1 hypothetical protein [Xanthobacter aminoxidans]
MNDMPRALRIAKLYWADGQPIPIDLFLELLDLGLDAQALEDEHLYNQD